MNKEKLQEIHSKRILNDRFKLYKTLFFADYTLESGEDKKSFNHWWYYSFKDFEQFKKDDTIETKTK